MSCIRMHDAGNADKADKDGRQGSRADLVGGDNSGGGEQRLLRRVHGRLQGGAVVGRHPLQGGCRRAAGQHRLAWGRGVRRAGPSCSAQGEALQGGGCRRQRCDVAIVQAEHEVVQLPHHWGRHSGDW